MLEYAGIGLAAADVNLLPDLPTILWTILDFAILLWGLNRLLFRPLMKKVNDREQAVEALDRQAGDDRTAAAKSLADSKSQLGDAKRQADGIIAVADRQAELLLARAEAEARQQAEAMMAEATATIEREREQAVAELHAQTADLAMRAAGRIIGGFLGENRQRGLCDIALAEVARLTVDDDVPDTIAVEVRTAAPLSLEDQDYLLTNLSEHLHRTIRLQPVVEPELVGGVVLKIGDHLVDGSVRAQLQRLYQQMTGKVWRWDNEHPSE